MCIGHVRLLGVVLSDWPTHPEFVPPDLVHSVVMTSAVGDGDIVEIPEGKERAERTLAPGASAVDSNPIEVHPRAFGGRGFHPGDAVRKSRVSEVFPGHVMKGFGPPVGAHAVDLDHDETKIGDVAHSPSTRERLRDEVIVWSRVDVFNDRIGSGWIEVLRANDHAPYVGFAVSSFRGKSLRLGPAACQQSIVIRGREFGDQ